MAPNTMSAARIILLVDGENFAATRAEILLATAEELGSLAEVRVYGHYREMSMKGWRDAAERWGLVKVDVTVTGSNTADFKLIVDAMDILHGRQLDAFGIASADTGFATLAERIRASAVRAYGFSDRKTSPDYQRRFDTFFDFTKKPARAEPPKAKTPPAVTKAAEKKPALRRTAPAPTAASPAPAAVPSPRTPGQTRAATRQPPAAKPAPVRAAPRQPPVAAKPVAAPKAAAPMQAPPAQPAQRARRGQQPATPKLPIPTTEILSAIEEVRESDGWSHLGSVSNQVRRRIKDFSPKHHGHATLKKLVAAMPDVESHTTPNGTAFVRRRSG